MRLFESQSGPSLSIVWRAIKGTCFVAGACAIGGILVSHHGWILSPLYAGCVWGWYFLETRIRQYRTFGGVE